MTDSPPLQELLRDRRRAGELNDAHAGLCTLATVDEHGLPHVRTLVLRELQGRLALFLNATSPKQRQLNSGNAAVCVYLASLQRQYRLRCGIDAIDDKVVHESWQLRPDAPKRMDWYYMQGRVQSAKVGSRDMLLAELDRVELPEPLTAPTSAAGYWLNPHQVERLDLDQENGVHDRVAWTLEGDRWVETTLVP